MRRAIKCLLPFACLRHNSLACGQPHLLQERSSQSAKRDSLLVSSTYDPSVVSHLRIVQLTLGTPVSGSHRCPPYCRAFLPKISESPGAPSRSGATPILPPLFILRLLVAITARRHLHVRTAHRISAVVFRRGSPAHLALGLTSISAHYDLLLSRGFPPSLRRWVVPPTTSGPACPSSHNFRSLLDRRRHPGFRPRQRTVSARPSRAVTALFPSVARSPVVTSFQWRTAAGPGPSQDTGRMNVRERTLEHF